MILIYSFLLDDLKIYFYGEDMRLYVTYCTPNVTSPSAFNTLSEVRSFFSNKNVIIHDDGES